MNLVLPCFFSLSSPLMRSSRSPLRRFLILVSPIEAASEVTTAMVTRKFLLASTCMWILPFAILYGFQHGWYPGFSNISPSSQTLLSGFLAVVSVNMMLAFYICMAMKEPTDKHQPDPAFVAKAKVKAGQINPSGGAKLD